MTNNVTEALPAEFPEDDVNAALERWWDEEKTDAALPGDKGSGADIMQPAVEIDSHRAVRALVSLEEILKFEIPETVIKEGGYETFEEMKEHLLPGVRAIFDKKRKKEHA